MVCTLKKLKNPYFITMRSSETPCSYRVCTSSDMWEGVHVFGQECISVSLYILDFGRGGGSEGRTESTCLPVVNG